MSLSSEGLPLMIGATVLAVITYALALRLRSWPLWLTAFAFTLLILVIAWAFRTPRSVAAFVSPSSPPYVECTGAAACESVYA